MTRELVPQLDRNLSPRQKEVLATGPPFAGGVFPNFSWQIFQLPAANGEMSSMMTIRTFNPRGPDRTEVMAWVMVEKDAPQAVKDSIRKTTIQNVSSSGMVEQDDSEMFVSVQRAIGRGAIARRQVLLYWATTGEPDPSTDLPGQSFVGFSKDDCLWGWWLSWRDFMTGGAW